MNKKAEKGQAYEPTHFEHIANTITHGVSVFQPLNPNDLFF